MSCRHYLTTLLLIGLFQTVLSGQCPSNLVTTIAGQAGVAGAQDGPAATATFNFPDGLVVGPDGSIYVADFGNHLIRKISPDGVVSTLAGSAGQSGTANGTGAEARFDSPTGVALDASGNIYVADNRNHAIRRITPEGETTTFAGLAGTSGFSDGPGASARFNRTTDVAVTPSGNILVADNFNSLVRSITPAGFVTTLAGVQGTAGFRDGPANIARFNGILGVAADTGGNVFVADNVNQLIRRIDTSGTVSTLAGDLFNAGSTDGTGSNATFDGPVNVVADGSGNVIVADINNHLIRRVTPAGQVTTVAGSAGMSGSRDGMGTDARFNRPRGVAVDAAGNIYVADRDNHLIRKIGNCALQNQVLYFAQFGDGGTLFSQIILVNRDPGMEASVTVTLRDDDGNPLSVDLNGEIVDGETMLQIPPAGLRRLRTDGEGDLMAGSVAVTSDRRLSGVILFGGGVGLAGVGSSEALENGFTAPIETRIVGQAVEVDTGIAVMNLETEELELTLILLNEDGEEVTRTMTPLPALGHTARFITMFFPGQDFSDFEGTIRVEVNGRIAATVIQTRPGQFATLPVSAN